MSSSVTVSRALRMDSGRGAFMRRVLLAAGRRGGAPILHRMAKGCCDMGEADAECRSSAAGSLFFVCPHRHTHGKILRQHACSRKKSARSAEIGENPRSRDAEPAAEAPRRRARPLRHRHPGANCSTTRGCPMPNSPRASACRPRRPGGASSGWSSRATSPATAPRSTAARSAWACWPSCASMPSATTPRPRARWKTRSARCPRWWPATTSAAPAPSSCR